jgi:putative transposase
MSAMNHYATDLSDEQWAILEPLLPKQKWYPGGPGRPPCDVRQVINAIFYVNKTGCQWRMLPRDFDHWNTVYGYFWRGRRGGLWSRMMEHLRHAERRRQGRQPEPSAGSIDSQSIKTATQDSDVGFDRNKRVKGRKRHLLVDTLGLIVAVVVTAAHIDDRQGVVALLTGYFADGVRRLRKLWVDGGYVAQWLWTWVWGLKRTHKVDLEVVEHQGKGFQVVPFRWVVERTFAWLLNYRRHRCDYEILTDNSAAMIQISMIHLLLNRLA